MSLSPINMKEPERSTLVYNFIFLCVEVVGSAREGV